MWQFTREYNWILMTYQWDYDSHGVPLFSGFNEPMGSPISSPPPSTRIGGELWSPTCREWTANTGGSSFFRNPLLISGWSRCDFSDTYLSWIWLGGYFSDITVWIRLFLLAGNCRLFVQLDFDGFCNWIFGDRKVRALNHHQWSSMHVSMS